MSSNPGSPDIRLPPDHGTILGVDPGSMVTGWGLISGSSARTSIVDCGTIRLGPRGAPMALRLGQLQDEMERLIGRLQPGSAAVESPYHGANARSALQLAHARGVILAVLARAGVEVAEYSPATVKKSVTGSGRAPKEQVQTMVSRLLSRPDLGASNDLSDALAVALCHEASRRRVAVASQVAAPDGRSRRKPGARVPKTP